MQKLQGFTYATVLDLNMGYCTICLDPDAQKICTIILPWEGLKQAGLKVNASKSTLCRDQSI
eukprot:11389527-Ditylum_brightwellii.AAC.1